MLIQGYTFVYLLNNKLELENLNIKFDWNEAVRAFRITGNDIEMVILKLDLPEFTLYSKNKGFIGEYQKIEIRKLFDGNGIERIKIENNTISFIGKKTEKKE